MAVWLCAVLVAACGTAPRMPVAYERPFRAAEGLERSGRHAEAAAAYARARAGCAGLVDACATAMLREARERERAGDAAVARAGYEAMARRYPRARDAPRALRRAAALRLAAGDLSGARSVLVHVVVDHPDHGETARALSLLLRSYDDAGDLAGADAALVALEPRTRGTQIGDNVLLERARLEVRAGRAADAERTLRALVRDYPYPAGAWDDALWMLAGLCEERGDARAAIAALEAMVAVHEDAAMVGSYNLPLFDDAELRIARLHLEALRDPVAAIRAAERLRDRYPDSVLRDDAVVLQARAEEARGRHAEACALRATLRELDPHSRFLRAGRWPVVCGEGGAAPSAQ